MYRPFAMKHEIEWLQVYNDLSKKEDRKTVIARRKGFKHNTRAEVKWCEWHYYYLMRFLCCLRMANLSPDQISLIAQTLLLTKPIGNATWRMTSSVISHDIIS